MKLELTDKSVAPTGLIGALLKSVTDIRLVRCQVDHALLPRLAEYGLVKTIWLEQCNVQDEIFDSIATLDGLQQLRLIGCPITGAGFNRLWEHCLDLKVLELRDCEIADPVMYVASQFRQLKALSLAGTCLVRPNLVLLNELPLNELDLGSTMVDDGTVMVLKNDIVYDLLLEGTQVTKGVLQIVRQCPRLGNIYLPNGVVVPSDELAAFRSHHPQCQVHFATPDNEDQ